MHSMHTFLVAAAIVSTVQAQEAEKPPLNVVPQIDLQRYLGTWYEIARLPNSFEKKCVGNITATYSLLDDGDIRVINRCRTANGEMSEAVGLAKLASKDGPNTKLKVRFAPAFLSFLPFVWGNYWIILLADDYRYAVIGEPDRKYLWILSRTPSIEEPLFQDILSRVKQAGYDVSTLERIDNSPTK